MAIYIYRPTSHRVSQTSEITMEYCEVRQVMLGLSLMGAPSDIGDSPG